MPDSDRSSPGVGSHRWRSSGDRVPETPYSSPSRFGFGPHLAGPSMRPSIPALRSRDAQGHRTMPSDGSPLPCCWPKAENLPHTPLWACLGHDLSPSGPGWSGWYRISGLFSIIAQHTGIEKRLIENAAADGGGRTSSRGQGIRGSALTGNASPCPSAYRHDFTTETRRLQRQFPAHCRRWICSVSMPSVPRR